MYVICYQTQRQACSYSYYCPWELCARIKARHHLQQVPTPRSVRKAPICLDCGGKQVAISQTRQEVQNTKFKEEKNTKYRLYRQLLLVTILIISALPYLSLQLYNSITIHENNLEEDDSSCFLFCSPYFAARKNKTLAK